MKDLLGQEILERDLPPPRNHSRPKKTGYAAPPGTGPEGETCRSCNHAYRTRTGTGKVFAKCGLVKATHGPGTDIKLKSPACSRWEARTE